MVISNGIKFTLEEAISYGLPIDSIDLESVYSEHQLELQELQDELEYADHSETCYKASCELDKQLDRLEKMIEVAESDKVAELQRIYDEIEGVSNKLGYV